MDRKLMLSSEISFKHCNLEISIGHLPWPHEMFDLMLCDLLSGTSTAGTTLIAHDRPT